MQNLKYHDFIILLDVIVGLVLFKRLNPPYMRILVCLFLVSLFVEICTPLKILRFKGNNWLLYNLYTPVEFLFFAGIYYAAFKIRWQRRFVLLTTSIIILFAAYNFRFLQGGNSFNSYSFIASSIGLTLFAFVQLIVLYSAPTTIVRFYASPLFWVSIGILFFYPPGIFSTGLITEIYKQYPVLAMNIYQINGTLNVLMYYSFLMALYIASINNPEYVVSYE